MTCPKGVRTCDNTVAGRRNWSRDIRMLGLSIFHLPLTLDHVNMYS